MKKQMFVIPAILQLSLLLFQSETIKLWQHYSCTARPHVSPRNSCFSLQLIKSCKVTTDHAKFPSVIRKHIYLSKLSLLTADPKQVVAFKHLNKRNNEPPAPQTGTTLQNEDKEREYTGCHCSDTTARAALHHHICLAMSWTWS